VAEKQIATTLTSQSLSRKPDYGPAFRSFFSTTCLVNLSFYNRESMS
jgi:hypothetical protein